MPETVLNSRYRLDDLIGEGGMAVVYRGHDLLLNRQVAVKVLRPQYAADANFLKRFEREAQAAAGFSHPNIVNVYDVGADGSQHYIVMEYIRGPSLKELIRRHGPFSVEGAIYIIGQVASALEYAHERGLIHRDIKPQNILVDRDGNAKVVDFGIAKGIRDANLTEAGSGMGTVHYVSPEQASGQPATPASDLYSTGVVLYEMLTRRLPFEADTPVGVAMLHVNQAPPPPTQFNPAIPPRVEQILLKVLSKNPADRYPSASAFANVLRHWDAPEEVRVETAALPVATAVSEPREQVVIRPSRPPTRTIPAPRGAGAVVVPPRPVPAMRRRPPSGEFARDDVGCATWLIGSAILLGLIGLVLLAFKVLPDMLDDGESPSGGVVGTLPTPTQVPPTPTLVATATSPPATPTIAVVAGASPTPHPATATTAPGQAGVPELAGMTVTEAEQLVDGRWQLVTVEQTDDVVPAGQIMSQSPEAGALLGDGGEITVVVSTGPGTVEVPVVAGMGSDAAISEIVAAGFDYTLAEEPSQEYDIGIVMRTEPESVAEPGATIVIVVSLGDVVLVPDVTSLDVDTATEQLNGAGLVVGQVYVASCNGMVAILPEFDCEGFPEGAVALMSATPDIYVPRGTVVDLTVYAGSI